MKIMDKQDNANKSLGPKYKMRIRFSRLGEAKNLTHLEQIRQVRKAFSLSKVPVFGVKSKKTSVPKISFGPAISMGYESLCEFADVCLTDLTGESEIKSVFGRIKGSGISFVSAKRVPLLFPSLEASINAVEYEVRGEFSEGFSQDKIKRALLKNELVFEKEKTDGSVKKIDFKPLVIKMEYCKEKSLVVLILAIKPGANIKPENAVEFIAGDEVKITGILKKQLYWLNSGGDFEVF